MAKNKNRLLIKQKLSAFNALIEKGFAFLYRWTMWLVDKWGFWILAAVFLILAVLMRVAFFSKVSGDTYWYLNPWVLFYRDHGNLAGIGQFPISYYNTTTGNVPYGLPLDGRTVVSEVLGNYPLGYYNLLALVSYLPWEPVIVVKILSVIFDVVLALAIAFIVDKLGNKNRVLTLVAWTVALLLPTGWLNSGLWGQSDAIYTALIAWCIYFMLKEKPLIAMIFLGFSFSIKIQTIFILPLFAWLFLNHKFKLRHLIVAFAMIVLTMVPAWIGGMNFLEPFRQYFSLAETYPNPNMNSGSFYVLFDGISGQFGATGMDIDLFGIPFALIIILLVVYVLYRWKVAVTPTNLLAVAALMATLVPFILPHMHERYFFLADFLVLLYVLVKRKRIYLAIFIQVASLITYGPFLLGGYIIPSLGRGTMLFAVGFNMAVIYFLLKDLHAEKPIDGQFAVDNKNIRTKNKKLN